MHIPDGFLSTGASIAIVLAMEPEILVLTSRREGWTRAAGAT